MEELTELFKVLSDETRLRIINLLYKQKLCVCELVEVLDLTQPKISKHIARLRSINLVNTERNEQYIYYSYSMTNRNYNRILSEVLNSDNEVLLNDMANMDKIRPFVCTQ